MDSSPDELRLSIRAVAIPKERLGGALGHAQLSLVEHALCPLDAAISAGCPFTHQTEYEYSDKNRHRRTANVRVICPEGLSPTDELYLWGLLSLTFSQPQPSTDFYATPYYCLRQLGCIDPSEARSGGKNYALFRQAITRLSSVSYRNDGFYDPIRGEHRDVAFGFLSYSLPLDPHSGRAWRFAWDPIFFEFCQAAAGALRFDFQAYRSFDPATRRLYLLLKKIFWRSDLSPDFDLHDLAVNVLGFSANNEPKSLKRKLARCTERLLDCGIIRLSPGVLNPKQLFTKRAKGQYSIRFHRGPRLDDTSSAFQQELTDSPLYEPLLAIGLDAPTIARVLKTYKPRLIAELADMTIAAKERYGETFFKSSPQAYFIDNLKEHASGNRTPPDWWRTMRKEEERRHYQDSQPNGDSNHGFEKAFDDYLKTEAREAFERVMNRLFQELRTGGQSDPDARENASHFARTHFVHRFRAEHPEWNEDGPTRLSDAA
jgi:hypothetical protein